jgi:hypothetical protein
MLHMPAPTYDEGLILDPCCYLRLVVLACLAGGMNEPRTGCSDSSVSSDVAVAVEYFYVQAEADRHYNFHNITFYDPCKRVLLYISVVEIYQLF